MKGYQYILRRVGLVFIIGGILDMGFMIYCAANKLGYSSSLNIYAVVAGVFLLKGNLKAARIISWFISISIGGYIVRIVIAPFLHPEDSLLTYFKLETISHIIAIILIFASIVLRLWGYRKITSVQVQKAMAMDESRVDNIEFLKKPIYGFLIGGCLAVFVAIFLFLVKKH